MTTAIGKNRNGLLELNPASPTTDDPTTTVAPAPEHPQEICAKILGEVDWVSETEGYCRCPGHKSHTTQNGERDCIIYLDNVPTISCFHGSCEAQVKEANTRLRAAILDGTPQGGAKPERLTAADKQRLRDRRRQQVVRLRAACSRRKVLDQFKWPLSEISDSPVSVEPDATQHWRQLLPLFSPKDVVWIGNLYDSGKSGHENHFQYRDDWLKQGAAPGQFICPATFKVGSFARANDNILERRFLVIESDTLGRDEVGAVFKWLRLEVGLNLRAIVDTAGKSLHAWFDFPSDDILRDLKLVLPALGCDPKLFTASQPVRLPGALRDGKHQRLVFLGKAVQP